MVELGHVQAPEGETVEKLIHEKKLEFPENVRSL